MNISLSSKLCLLFTPLFTLCAATAPTPPIIDLFKAIAEDDEDRVSELLVATPSLVHEKHPHPNSSYTALHYAVGKGKVAFAKLLIEESADVNAQDNEGGTPLMWWAVTSQDEAMRNVLLGAGAVAAHGKTCPSNYPNEAHFAKSRLRHLDLLNGISTGIRTKLTAPLGSAPTTITDLLRAVESNGENLVKEMLDARPALVHERDLFCGWTPLHIAIKNGNLEIVQLLINKGANVNSGDDRLDVAFPLMWNAIFWNDHIEERDEIRRLLVQAGARATSRPCPEAYNGDEAHYASRCVGGYAGSPHGARIKKKVKAYLAL